MIQPRGRFLATAVISVTVTALVLLAGWATPSFAQANLGPSAVLGKDASSDFWRQIRDGKTGYVPGSTENANWLIRRSSKDAKCVAQGTCTERVVGFIVPIHDKMPKTRERVGVGPTDTELYFVYGLFAALVVAGLGFLVFGLRDRPLGIQS